MSLPDLSHQSAPEARGEEHRDAEDGGPFYSCIHCGGQWITVRVPDSPCPDRVLAWGDEREAKGREAERAAAVEYLRTSAERPHPIECGSRALSPSARSLLHIHADAIERGDYCNTGPEQP